MLKGAEIYTHTHTHTHGCLCKIIPIIATFAIIIPTYANIDKDAQSATCDSSTIGTTTGPANLQADWTANTINLKWYDGNNEISIANGAAQKTCTYDGAITLPSTPPIPAGYTFGGWKVRQASATAQNVFNLTTWNYGEITDDYGWKSLNGTGENENDTLINNGEWFAVYENGAVKGVATCTATPGNEHTMDNEDWENLSGNILSGNTFVAGEYNDTDKQYCWCKATGVDTIGNGIYQSVTPSSWVFNADNGSAAYCAHSCAMSCLYFLVDFDAFRSSLFGTAQ